MDFTSLKAAISDWLVGHDLSSQVETFIAMAEADFNRTLRLRRMMRRVTTTIGEGEQSVAVPADFLETIQMTVDGIAVHPVTLDRAEAFEDASSTPLYYVVSGDEIAVVPAPSEGAEITLLYFAAVPSLSALTPTNFLIEANPDLYIHASLSVAAAYVNDAERGALWRTEAERIKSELMRETEASRYGGSPLVMRPRRAL